MKRAALYIRVSTDEQARHGFSLQEQEYDLKQYAQRKNYHIVGIYADEGNSARKAISRRKELQRLLLDVQNNKVDVILLKCLDRWFRNVKDFYTVQEVLDKHHVEWECTQEDYNTTTTNGRLMLNLKLSIAQNESDQTSDRIKYINQGKRRRKEALSGKVAWGIEIINKHYSIIKEKQPVIAFIFDECFLGKGIRTIGTSVLEKFGIALSAKQIRSMLRNPIYKGMVDGISDYCPAAIEPNQFDRVQKLLSINQRPKPQGYIYLFTGKIVCPSCGNRLSCKQMRYRNGTKSPGYICGNRYSTGKPSKAKDSCQFGGGIREAVLERFLVKNIQELIRDYLVTFNTKFQQKNNAKEKIQMIHFKLNRLKDLYVDGLIEKTTYRNDYEKLQKELSEAIYTEQMGREKLPLLDQIVNNNDFMSFYEALPIQKRRDLWQVLIERIEIGSRPVKSGMAYKDFIVHFN